jgi:hypothetical protein
MANKKASAKSNPVDLGKLYDDNVRLLVKSSEVAMKSYIEIVKTLTDPRLASTGANLARQLAEGWRDALMESNKILRNAYANIGKQIK